VVGIGPQIGYVIPMDQDRSAPPPGGMSRPSAFAVLRLSTNSNLVGSTTGKSLGWITSSRSPDREATFDEQARQGICFYGGLDRFIGLEANAAIFG
jgi:hypothetical protein